jgi:hypothetical protein
MNVKFAATNSKNTTKLLLENTERIILVILKIIYDKE